MSLSEFPPWGDRRRRHRRDSIRRADSSDAIRGRQTEADPARAHRRYHGIALGTRATGCPVARVRSSFRFRRI